MKTLEISDETYEKIKDQLNKDEVLDINQLQDLIGKKFFFRTVTYHLVGEVVKSISSSILELKNASWVADSGRFMQAIRDGVLSEVEPVGIAYLNINSVTDFFPWRHQLPKDQK